MTPKIGDVQAQRAGLSKDRLALLERWTRGRAKRPTDTIPRRSTTGPAPLSFSQERLWLLDQLLGPGNAYNTIPVAARVQGVLDLALLQRCIDEMVLRHDTLRTTIATVDGQPRQLVAATMPAPLEIVDLRDQPDPEGEALRRIRAAGHQPIGMAVGPLFTISLFRLGADEHILLLRANHMISDGWSDDIFVRELASLYIAWAAGQPSPLPPLPIQYADFAAWQRTWLSGDMLENLTRYWRSRLADAPAALELPFDHPRSATPRFVSSTHWTDIPAGVTAALKQVGRSEGATLFMTTLAALDVLLARYSGQTDIVVGSPVANRTRVETEHLIGCFINTLVLRADVSGNPTFRALLGRVRETTLGAYEHQELPFERLVDEIRPDRDMSRNPLFQVMFVMQNSPTAELELGDFRLTPIFVDNGVARVDLTIELRELGDGMRARFQFDQDLFDPATCERVIAHFTRLLATIAADPDRRVADLALLSDDERERIVVDWNATEQPRDLVCIHRLIETQVARHPDATAVTAPDGDLTYRRLDERANALAQRLVAQGVGPDTRVGLCVDRSVHLPLGILGILKSGGAYVPMDPRLPPDRLAFMLADAKAPVIVTQQALVDDLPDHGATVLCLDAADEADGVDALATAPDVPGLTPGHLAYVLYTSGSTGRPKGVMIPHAAVTNLAMSTIGESGAGPGDTVLQYATSSFDVSVLETFTALGSGARLVIPSSEVVLSPPALTTLMQAQDVTFADIPPAVLELLPADAFPALRFQLIGGEAFSGPLATRWQAPHRRAFNGYGPTEATVTMTLMELDGPYDQQPPIGFPMPNHQVHVLDPWMQPVPVGVTGEMYLGGAGLARGYLDRPDLTADRFVPNPFGPPGSRLYRSGDRARLRDDGAIEFLGRLDGQVKIRGHRIEIGEIETVLTGFPSVQQAVVVVHEDARGTRDTRQLVAYVLSNGSASLETAALRTWLGQRLPSYMVPTTIVAVDEFPLVASGKVDRAKLPDPSEVAGHGDDAYALPRDDLETLVVTVFAQVLEVDRVGIHDNFFERGGNSLQMAEVQSRLRDATDIEVPLRSLFLASSPAQLAEHLADLAQVTAAPLDDGAREEGEL